MGIYMVGGGLPHSPFDRTFFNVTIGEILSRASPDQGQALTLFLADGTMLDVCDLQELSDRYVALRVYRGAEEACDTSLHLVPYGLIYRIEIGPKGGAGPRMGFRWTGAPRKAVPARKAGR